MASVSRCRQVLQGYLASSSKCHLRQRFDKAQFHTTRKLCAFKCSNGGQALTVSYTDKSSVHQSAIKFNYDCSRCFDLVNIVATRSLHSTSGRAFPPATEVETNEVDKVIRCKLPSCRLDAILKAGLGMSRNKVEKALYDDRVRVNGERPKKKSITLDEGDEVDVVRGFNKLNPEKFLDVNRVEVIEITVEDKADTDEDSDDESSTKIPAVLRRSKMLTIKNYTPPWKGPSDNE